MTIDGKGKFVSSHPAFGQTNTKDRIPHMGRLLDYWTTGPGPNEAERPKDYMTEERVLHPHERHETHGNSHGNR
jgi:hypothetical protein